MDEESEEESCETETDTDSDWKAKRGQRKMGKIRRKRRWSHRPAALHRSSGKTTTNRPSHISSPLREKIRNAAQFPVTCGHKEGVLHKDKFNNSEPCIFSAGHWFTPTQFEQFGGKERNKKWKISILYHDVQLQTVIQEGLLSSPSFKQRKRKKEEHPGTLLDVSSVTLRQKKRGRTTHPSRSTIYSKDSTSVSSSDCGTCSEDDEEEEEEEGGDDMALFHSDSFTVKCSRGIGTLHKKRFVTGRSGKCIRTELRWFTPEEFVNSNLSNGNWRRDITSHSTSLGTLIMRKVLELHAINCKCTVCTGKNMLDQDNDDVCFICNCDGDLVCCDSCPRAFHHHCHKPALQDETLGERWVCSFCDIYHNLPS